MLELIVSKVKQARTGWDECTEVIKWLHSVVRPAGWIWFLQVLNLFVLAPVESVGIAWVFRHLTNAAVARDIPALRNSILVAIAIMVVESLSFITMSIWFTRARSTYKSRLQINTLERIILSPARIYFSHGKGEWVSIVQNDAAQSGTTVPFSLLNVVYEAIHAIAAFIYLVLINANLALAAMALVIINLTLSLRQSPSLRRAWEQRQQAAQKANGSLAEIVRGKSTIRMYDAKEVAMKGFRERTRDAVESDILSNVIANRSRFTSYAVTHGTMTLFRLLTGWMVLVGRMTPGDMIAYPMLVSGVMWPLTNLVRSYTDLQSQLVSGKRCATLAGAVPLTRELPSAQGSPTIPSVPARTALSLSSPPAIEVDRVVFGYDDKRPAILSGISFRVPAGSLCCLVGPNGVGKTTTLRLLLKMYEPVQGEIRINGLNLREISPEVWSQFVGWVPQEDLFLSGSVLDNITLGRPGITREMVSSAVSLASFSPVLESLGNGLEYEIGESGKGLSTGQRRRLALARALAPRPPLILLDEPTAAVDEESAELIRRSLRSLTRTSTIVVCTHDPQLVEMADQIVTLGDTML